MHRFFRNLGKGQWRSTGIVRCTCRHLMHDELGRILRIPLVKVNKYRLR